MILVLWLVSSVVLAVIVSYSCGRRPESQEDVEDTRAADDLLIQEYRAQELALRRADSSMRREGR